MKSEAGVIKSASSCGSSQLTISRMQQSINKKTTDGKFDEIQARVLCDIRQPVTTMSPSDSELLKCEVVSVGGTQDGRHLLPLKLIELAVSQCFKHSMGYDRDATTVRQQFHVKLCLIVQHSLAEINISLAINAATLALMHAGVPLVNPTVAVVVHKSTNGEFTGEDADAVQQTHLLTYDVSSTDVDWRKSTSISSRVTNSSFTVSQQDIDGAMTTGRPLALKQYDSMTAAIRQVIGVSE